MHADMYTPSLLPFRFPLYSCGRKCYDMRFTRVNCGDERCTLEWKWKGKCGLGARAVSGQTRSVGECNAITNRSFGESDLTFVST
jgi:hypothetical protein